MSLNVLTNPPRFLTKRKLCFLCGRYSTVSLRPNTKLLHPLLLNDDHLAQLGLTKETFTSIRRFDASQTRTLLELLHFTDEDVSTMRELEQQYRKKEAIKKKARHRRRARSKK